MYCHYVFEGLLAGEGKLSIKGTVDVSMAIVGDTEDREEDGRGFFAEGVGFVFDVLYACFMEMSLGTLYMQVFSFTYEMFFIWMHDALPYMI